MQFSSAPIGVTYNNTAPRLFMDTGAALSANIRETGKAIEQNIFQMQTNRQLKQLGAELQGLDVQSPDFSRGLIGIATKYPLAIQDQRGQQVLSLLGTANKAYLSQQSGDREFQQRLQLEGVRQGNRLGEMRAEEEMRSKRPVQVGLNERMVDPVTGEVLVEAAPLPRAGSSLGPYRPGPGGMVLNTETGDVLREPDARLASQPKDETLKLKLQSFNRDLTEMGRKFNSLDMEKDNSEKTALGQEILRVRDQRDKLLDSLQYNPNPSPVNGMRSAPLFPLPTQEEAPQFGPPAPAQVSVKTSIRKDPKTGKRYEVNVDTREIVRELP